MTALKDPGFDDIVVLAPIAPVISDSLNYLAKDGVMNVFAGVARGTMAALDLNGAFQKNQRVIGHSASWMKDFLLVLDKTSTGELSPNRSVAAIGSLSAARNGLQAVKDASLAGKVLIYPNIKELPLTPLSEFKEKFPSVMLASMSWASGPKRQKKQYGSNSKIFHQHSLRLKKWEKLKLAMRLLLFSD